MLWDFYRSVTFKAQAPELTYHPLKVGVDFIRFENCRLAWTDLHIMQPLPLWGLTSGIKFWNAIGVLRSENIENSFLVQLGNRLVCRQNVFDAWSASFSSWGQFAGHRNSKLGWSFQCEGLQFRIVNNCYKWLQTGIWFLENRFGETEVDLELFWINLLTKHSKYFYK